MKLWRSSDILTQVSVVIMPSINGTCSRIKCDIKGMVFRITQGSVASVCIYHVDPSSAI